jgi:cutinase
MKRYVGMDKLKARRIAGFLVIAVAATWALIAVTAANPSAVAEPCPDVEVVFASGTSEAPGVGAVGQVFVDSLRGQAGARSVGVYPVNYPASTDFASSVAAGASDASGHVQSMTANCPNTKVVLGGFSQGATVVDTISQTMPPAVADHVAAVAVFGTPRSAHAASIAGGAPLPAISPLYAPKTIDQCVHDDPICSEPFNPLAFFAHDSYAFSGMAVDAAKFAVGRL